MRRSTTGIASISAGLAIVAAVCFGLIGWNGGGNEEGSTGKRPSGAAVALFRTADPWERAVGRATLGALEAKYCEEGADATIGCLDAGDAALILHPDTPPERREELLRQIEEFYATQSRGKAAYNSNNRWVQTATDVTTGLIGDPITLTWGFLPDGVIIPTEYGSPSAPSILSAVFDTAFANPNQWKNKVRSAMSKWDEMLGSTYIEVSYDDSAFFPSSAGVLGVRPDVRIGGKSVDGRLGIVAYNYYPNGGDMVLDVDDVTLYLNPLGNYTYLKNVIMHEHGHGLGLGHVLPSDQTKLMEPSVTAAYQFAQDDDIRGAQRYYGDYLENNDFPFEAADLGTLVDTLIVENLSIDRGTDSDFYTVKFLDPYIDIEVTPVGSTYLVGDEGGSPPAPVSTDSICDPDIRIWNGTGTTLLDSSITGALGEVEELHGFAPPSTAAYMVEVFRKPGTGEGIQRYTLTIVKGIPTGSPTGIAGAGEGTPAAGLALAALPNPFNPRTTVRFNMAEEGPYRLEIYDVAGRLVAGRSGRAGPGRVELPWDGRSDAGAEAASGLYLMRVTAVGMESTVRAVLIR